MPFFRYRKKKKTVITAKESNKGKESTKSKEAHKRHSLPPFRDDGEVKKFLEDSSKRGRPSSMYRLDDDGPDFFPRSSSGPSSSRYSVDGASLDSYRSYEDYRPHNNKRGKNESIDKYQVKSSSPNRFGNISSPNRFHGNSSSPNRFHGNKSPVGQYGNNKGFPDKYRTHGGSSTIKPFQQTVSTGKSLNAPEFPTINIKGSLSLQNLPDMDDNGYETPPVDYSSSDDDSQYYEASEKFPDEILPIRSTSENLSTDSKTAGLANISSAGNSRKKTSRVRFSKIREEIYQTSSEEESSDEEEEEDLDEEQVLEWEEDMQSFLEMYDQKIVGPGQFDDSKVTLESILEVEEETLETMDYFSQPKLFTGLSTNLNLVVESGVETSGRELSDGKSVSSSSADVSSWLDQSVRNRTPSLEKSEDMSKLNEYLDGKIFLPPMDDGGSSLSSASYGSFGSSCNEELVIRVHVPELNLERCLTFNSHDLVWTVKQTALTSLPKELRESFNYGLFCPPQNGRAGKFLDEERPLCDYPFTNPVGYLELKYKRRVYKMLKLEEKSLRALHTRANLKRFLEWVKECNLEKVTKMCSKGIDPNFHCQESGDTPLTLAAKGNLKGRKSCSALLVTLVNGGALLDYRTKEGLTAMHRAVQADNLEAVRTLLDLGASPNYRDHRGLTPLYYCVTYSRNPLVCEALLHDYATIGVADQQGWQETHQACRNKLVSHLEHLLFYGADLNAQNASGNTPLHVCAVNNLEDCARVLLFRGCDKNALNFANQSPYQVAVISGNMELAEVINKHNAEHVVPFKSPPKYNPRRRVSGAPLLRAASDPRLEGQLGHKPPSPAPSTRSIPPFSSASSLSGASTGSGSTTASNNSNVQQNEQEQCYQQEQMRHPAYTSTGGEALSDTSSGVGSSYQSSGEASSTGIRNNSLLNEKPSPPMVSDVTEEDEEQSTSSSSSDECATTDSAIPNYPIGSLVICVAQHEPRNSTQLALNLGDLIQVTGSTDDGLLEGVLRGVTGTFPPDSIQSVKLRNPQTARDTLFHPQNSRVLGRGTSFDGSTPIGGSIAKASPHYGTVPRNRKEQQQVDLRSVILHRGKKGFGFVLRGAKATSPHLDRDNGVALQYLDDVDPGGVADAAGLKPGDYLLRINGEDVSKASHEHVVNLIRKSADTVEMLVITPVNPPAVGGSNTLSPSNKPPPFVTTTVKRNCQTLPRKHTFSRSLSQTGSSPPAPPPRDPTTSLSVGRARARSVVGSLHQHLADDSDLMLSQKLASIKARPGSSHRMTASQVEEMLLQNSSQGFFLPSSPESDPSRPHKVYASVAEMKKAKAHRSRQPVDNRGLHKVFHSTPDLPKSLDGTHPNTLSIEDLSRDLKNQESRRTSLVYTQPNCQPSLRSFTPNTTRNDQQSAPISHGSLDHRKLKRSQSAVNTSHMAGEDPVGQLIKVEIGRAKGEYASVAQTYATPMNRKNDTAVSPMEVMSSFRPSDSAKLYASPEQVKTVGYRDPRTLIPVGKRSQSLPPNAQRAHAAKGAEKDSSLDSGVYSTHSTFRTDVEQVDDDDDLPLPPPPPELIYARPQNNNRVMSDNRMSTSYTAATTPYQANNQMSTSYTAATTPYQPNSQMSTSTTTPYQANNQMSTSYTSATTPYQPNNQMSTSYTAATTPYQPNNQMSTSYTAATTPYQPNNQMSTSTTTPYQANNQMSTSYTSTTTPYQPNNQSGVYSSTNIPHSQEPTNQNSSQCSPPTHSTLQTSVASSVVNSSSSPSQVEDPYSSEEESTLNSQYEEKKKKKQNGTIFTSTNGKKTSPYAAPIKVQSTSPPAQSTSSPPPPPPPPALTEEENFCDMIAKKAAEQRLKRESSSGNNSTPSSTSASPNKKVSGGQGISNEILNSALFNKQKEKTNGVKEEAKTSTSPVNSVEEKKSPPPVSAKPFEMKNSKSFPNKFISEDKKPPIAPKDKSPVSESVKSFVTVINTECNSIKDSKSPIPKEISKKNSLEERSISSESSEDGSDKTWILTDDKSEKSESTMELSSKEYSSSPISTNLAKNSTSLSKLTSLPENSICNQIRKPEARLPNKDQKAPHAGMLQRDSQSRSYQQLPSSHPLASSHPLPYHLQTPIHPSNTHVGQARFSTLQRPSSKRFNKAGSEPPLSVTHENRKLSGTGTLIRSRSINREEMDGNNSGSSTLDRNYHKMRHSTHSLSKGTEYERSIDESLQLIRMHMNSLNEVNDLAGIPSRRKPTKSEKESAEVLAPPPQFSDTSAQYGSEYQRGVNSDDEEDATILVHKRSNRRLEQQFSKDSKRVFKYKPLDSWTTKDTTDWLESLHMEDHMNSFEKKQIDGDKLSSMNNESLIKLGVRRVKDRVDMEKSLKRYRQIERIDL